MTTTRSRRRSLLLSLALFAFVAASSLIGCDSNNQAPANPDFAGSWNGVIRLTSGPGAGAGFEVTVTVWQDGDQVTGTYTNDDLINGSLHGTVGGNRLTFQMDQAPPCAGEFFGNAYLTSSDQLQVEYYGVGCNGEVSAEMLGTRL